MLPTIFDSLPTNRRYFLQITPLLQSVLIHLLVDIRLLLLLSFERSTKYVTATVDARRLAEAKGPLRETPAYHNHGCREANRGRHCGRFGLWEDVSSALY